MWCTLEYSTKTSLLFIIYWPNDIAPFRKKIVIFKL